MTNETGHQIADLFGADPTTVGALAACVVATGAAIAIHPRGWAMWAGLGIAMATFALSRTGAITTGAHLATALHVATLVAVVACAVGVGIEHLQRWTAGTRFPQAVWMVAMGLLAAMAALPSPVAGDANLIVGAGLALTCVVLMVALSSGHTTADNGRQASVARGAMAVLVALPAAWAASARMPETAYTHIVGNPLATAFVVVLLTMALVRLAWAPWFLAAAIGVALSAGALLAWPLVGIAGAWAFEWARRTGHPSATLLGGAVWATVVVGGAQTWLALGTSDTWGWWAITIGLAVAGISAIHTIPVADRRGKHHGS
jgi:hypothetical protein